MDYKRKVCTQQEGINGNDREYGELKMLARSKRTMPIIFASVMLIFALSIFSTGWETLSDNTTLIAFGRIFTILIEIIHRNWLGFHSENFQMNGQALGERCFSGTAGTCNQYKLRCRRKGAPRKLIP